MPIQLLDQDTINKIAAGEVIERPSSVVKELVENAIDAGATAITVEIKEGGISFIRITDNGQGIVHEEIKKAFLSHATSKIKSVEDLMNVASLGFRGEALSSIAAVSQVELVTKTADSFIGSRYVIEGGKEVSLEEVGAPDGTTFIVRNLFYNTPVRRKFLKTSATEAGYINTLLEHLALSHPDISLQFISNNQSRLHTSGNTNLKDIIYSVYGRDLTKNLLDVEAETQDVAVKGYIGKPSICRGNRLYENYYINGRYIKSHIVTKAIEEAYKGYIMPHNYPFTALHFTINPAILDVNVHPTKMELRFSKNEFVYQFILETLKKVLAQRELVPEVRIHAPNVGLAPNEKLKESMGKKPGQEKPPEPFEVQRLAHMQAAQQKEREHFSNAPVNTPGKQVAEVTERQTVNTLSSRQEQAAKILQGYRSEQAVQSPEYGVYKPVQETGTQRADSFVKEAKPKQLYGAQTQSAAPTKEATQPAASKVAPAQPTEVKPLVQQYQNVSEPQQSTARKAQPEIAPQQLDLFEHKLLDTENTQKYRIIGQLFDTYWLIEFEDKFYMLDQHAAHEKVLYERFMKKIREQKAETQMLLPPLVISLNMQEQQVLKEHWDVFQKTGYEIEEFGGREYIVKGFPATLPSSIDLKQLLVDMIDTLAEQIGTQDPDSITERVATMSCKAAVKGNNRLSFQEAEELMREMMQAENPYNCPHGRPTLIMMTKYEIERKFKRIL